ncbi:MAG: OmpH family outer membrane protein [Mangrovibacterium sp.]|nr:OmpH family outer membrane protein [Mangrovibacterium sp.]
MKKILFTAVFLIVASAAMAQKYAYVDMEYIFNNIPAYAEAQERLKQISDQYQKELENKRGEIEKMYNAYQNESGRLPAETKRKREDAIIAAEKEYKELQRQYFGPEGVLSKKQEEIVKPIQDEALKTVQSLAVSGGYAVIFDKAAGSGMIYANPQFDLSDQVLQKLGYKK